MGKQRKLQSGVQKSHLSAEDLSMDRSDFIVKFSLCDTMIAIKV